jgi:FkbM family methyltransferase
MFDLNLLKNGTQVRSDAFEGAFNWTWIAGRDETWDVICNDWVTHHKSQILKWFPNGGTTAVMAGGNCGLYPALLAQYFSLVYTFEPDPVHFHCLVNNCQFPNIMKMQAALGAHADMVAVSRHFEGNTGMTQVAEVDRNCIPVMTIDQFQFKELDLIMLDTEGFEFPILQGAADTLARLNPKIIIELGDVDQGELENHAKCVAFLEKIGYNRVNRIGRLDYAIERP